MIQEHDRPRDARGPTSYPAFVDWRNGSRAFDAVAAVTAEPLDVTITGQGEPAVVTAAAVSGEFFDLLGVPPSIGRTIHTSDDRSGVAVAVLSDTLWRERFGGDPDVVGRVVTLAGHPHTIAGVMPAQFGFPDEVDLWLAMRAEERVLSAQIADRLFEDVGAGVGWLTVIGRLIAPRRRSTWRVRNWRECGAGCIGARWPASTRRHSGPVCSSRISTATQWRRSR